MIFKLRVLRGKLQNRGGGHAGAEVAIRKQPFLIGTSPNCQLRCQGKSISPSHCELTISDAGLTLRDLDSGSGTFVNDSRIEGRAVLLGGDTLRVGRLEFEVMVHEETTPRTTADAMSDYVSDLLGEADAEDRARRMEDPLTRLFDVNAEDPPLAPVTDETPENAERPVSRPPRKPPGKLPPPPEYVADDTVQAAQETLEKIFQRQQQKKS